MAEVAASVRTHVRLQQRILVFLGVCLPVPVFAATGLSIPLPATVERMAAELVPFADAAPLGQSPLQTRGSIVLTPAEARPVRLILQAAPASHPVGAKPSPKQLEQRLEAVPAPRSPVVPAENEADPGPIEPPAQRKAEPPLPPPPSKPVTAPADDAPAPGAEAPKPKPEPEPEEKDKAKPKPKPKPKKPKPNKPKPNKPKPDKPKPDKPEPKEPQEPKEPKPKKPGPESQPEPETHPEHGERMEQDKGRGAGKPSKTAPEPTE
jgi:hypothetical protein